MKVFGAVVKIMTALAAVAGAVYVLATYGDKIVAWAKKLLNCSCCCCGKEARCGEEAEACGEEECCRGEECDCDTEAAAEEAPAEENVAEEEPAAQESDFEA